MQSVTSLPGFGRVRHGIRARAVLAGVLATLAFGASENGAATPSSRKTRDEDVASPSQRVGDNALHLIAPASAGGIVEQPLAPRSGPRGRTLFVTIAPEDSLSLIHI